MPPKAPPSITRLRHWLCGLCRVSFSCPTFRRRVSQVNLCESHTDQEPWQSHVNLCVIAKVLIFQTISARNSGTGAVAVKAQPCTISMGKQNSKLNEALQSIPSLL